ncbi:putative Short-chain dehydrogenase fogD [Seiridium cardinale]|uniref:Short-chain dehydrogenase fogD n=1 Tax=Seiridium cardinale TaxID=138064 RepID=A0ABR2XWY3_9PEZI
MAKDRKFALVTGCGQGGIGEALVKEYARRGLHPIATVLPTEPSDHLVSAGIDFFPLDVTKDESVLELKRNVARLTGSSLHILVNNAGICYTMPAIDTDVSAVQDMFNVNVFGPMRMVHHFHGFLVKSRGTIVNAGSIGGIVPYVYGSSYNASKAAVQHWSNTLRVEMAPLGVTVITLVAGEVGTNILKRDANRELPSGSLYSPLAAEFKSHVQRVPNTTNRFKFAENVVSQTLKVAPPAWFWYGNTTLVVWLLDTFAWRTVWDSIFSKDFKLHKLKV